MNARKHIAVTLSFNAYCCLQHDLLVPSVCQEFIEVE